MQGGGRSTATASVRRAVVAAVSAATLLAGCGDDDGSAPGTAPTTPATGSPPAGPATTASTAVDAPATVAPPTPEVRTVTVAFAGGEVVGGATEVAVAAGERVRLEVTSDVEEEVHVHGFDLSQPVGPGTPAELEFVVDLPGVWEVELEGSGVELVRLEVRG